jgi:hypothetical protein
MTETKLEMRERLISLVIKVDVEAQGFIVDPEASVGLQAAISNAIIMNPRALDNIAHELRPVLHAASEAADDFFAKGWIRRPSLTFRLLPDMELSNDKPEED